MVKAFNHIYAAQLTTDGRPAGTPERRALVIAGDDSGAKAVVAQLIDAFGFDTVDAGPLAEGWVDSAGHARLRPAPYRGGAFAAISLRQNATRDR